MNSLVYFSDWTEEVVAFFLLALPRTLGFWTGFPILGSSLVSSLIMRVTIAVSLSLMLHPILTGQYDDFSAVEFNFGGLRIKRLSFGSAGGAQG